MRWKLLVGALLLCAAAFPSTANAQTLPASCMTYGGPGGFLVLCVSIVSVGPEQEATCTAFSGPVSTATAITECAVVDALTGTIVAAAPPVVFPGNTAADQVSAVTVPGVYTACIAGYAAGSGGLTMGGPFCA